MRESILQNLLEGEWAGKEGREALNLFFELVGLGSSTDSFDLSQKVVEDIQIVRYHFLSLCSFKFSNSRNNHLLFQLPQRIIHLTLESFDDLSFKPSLFNLPVAHMLKLNSQVVSNLKSECDKHWLTGFLKLRDIMST